MQETLATLTMALQKEETVSKPMGFQVSQPSLRGSEVVASAFLGVAIDLTWSGSNTLRIGSNLSVRTEIWSAVKRFGFGSTITCGEVKSHPTTP
ncbi:unnamed protein product [Linum trigynum]|uniref:Uncharacterized protein n=1 Tax=Linum trigynum TaxID=586398 RepID=A0AAV2E043_9ROSI